MANRKKTISKYEGKYIATESFNQKTVVASGKDPLQVRARAQSKGITSPVITFVPRGDAFNIF